MGGSEAPLGTGTSGVLWLAAARMQKGMGSLAVTGEGLQFQEANLQKEVQGRGVAPSTPPASTPAAQYTGGGW